MMVYELSSPFYRRENWDSSRLSNSPCAHLMHGRTQAPAQVLSNLSPQLPPLSHVSTLCVMTQSWGSPTLHAKSWGWWMGLDNFIMILETWSGGFVSETLGFWLKSARNWLEEAVWPRLTQARCGQQRKQPQVTGHSAQSADCLCTLLPLLTAMVSIKQGCQAGDTGFNITLTYQNPLIGDFPGSPVVKASPFYYTGAGWSLVGELRSFMLHSVAKKKRTPWYSMFWILNKTTLAEFAHP